MHKLRVYLGESLGNYGFPNGHPFGPWRMGAFEESFRQKGLEKHVVQCAPVIADQTAIERFHTHDYVEMVKTKSQLGEGFLDYGDTPAFPGVYDASVTAVGSCLDAVERIMNNEFSKAFVPIAGLHHARRDAASGFCVFNDCGVVIETLLQNYGLDKIAYVDIDAHHGDGVFYSFEDNPHVIIADIHEDGQYLYPGTGTRNETGKGPAMGTKLNIPLPPKSDENDFYPAWEKIETFLIEHKPQFILLQCGVDSLDGDPITHMKFTPECHKHAARRLAHLADEICGGRLLVTGGGGYEEANIREGWCAVVEGVIG